MGPVIAVLGMLVALLAPATAGAAAAPSSPPPAPPPPTVEVEPLATGPGSITQTDYLDGGHRNWDAVVLQGHDLVHYWRANSDPRLVWHRADVVTHNASGPGAIIQSDYGREFPGGHGNLEVVVPEGGRLVHYWRNSNLDGAWTRAETFADNVTGAPSLIQSDFGKEVPGGHGNFEVVVPEGHTLAHYWRVNGDRPGAWQGGPTNITGADSAASLIQSDFTYQGHGNLELVVREGDHVAHYWHVYGEPMDAWHRGQTFGSGVTDAPALIQSDFGREVPGGHGNFEVLVPQGTTLMHYWHVNGNPADPWQGPRPVATGVHSSAALIQSDQGTQFGDHGNFEAVVLGPPAPAPQPGSVATGDQPDFVLRQYYQDNTRPDRPWRQAQDVTYRGRSEKVCQLTGQRDMETGRPTADQTGARADLGSTDLGYPIDPGPGQPMTLLFGDSRDRVNQRPVRDPSHPELEWSPDDSSATSTSTAPPTSGSCLPMAFDTSGGMFTSPTVQPRIPQGLFNVPAAGFTIGSTLYTFFWNLHCANLDDATHDCAAPTPGYANKYGVATLARKDTPNGQPGNGYTKLYDLPASRPCPPGPCPSGFSYPMAAVNTDTLTGLPADQGLGVYFFGSSLYRAGEPYLAYAPPGQIADQHAWRYFNGIDAASGAPKWSSNPSDAVQLFGPDAGEPAPGCMGEASTTWLPQLHKWLMLYNCGPTVRARTAAAPWGPWSAPTEVFEPNADQAYCRYMHNPAGPGSLPCTDHLDADGQNNARGEPYAPYVLPRFTGTNPDGSLSIYYLLSTWNPYQAMIMHMNLRG